MCLQEIAESERRLLEAQVRVLPTLEEAQVDAPVGVLQEKIDALQKERGCFCWLQLHHFCRGQPQCGWEMAHLSLDNIPPLPSANVQDVERWLKCRNCDIAAVAMLTTFSQDVPIRPVHPGVGADQRGRHQEEVRRTRSARWSVTRDSRYGLCGCWIGEAPKSRPTRHQDPTRGCLRGSRRVSGAG